MKRAFSLAAVLLLLALLLTGCDDYTLVRMVNLQDRAIVQGVGVDWDGSEFEVTMQVFSPEGAGGQTMVDPSKENAQMITCRGASIAEAVESSARNQGKEFYLGHNRIVILGWEAVQQPLGGLLSYFVNSLDSRPDVTILFTKGKAKDVLSVGITQSILPAMSIENTIRNAERNGLGEEVLLIDVLEALAEPYRDAVIPMIETAGEEEAELGAVEITGVGIISPEGYGGEVAAGEMRGLLTLRDTIRGAVYTLRTADCERAAVQLYQNKTKLSPVLRDGQPAFVAEIAGKWTLVEKKMRGDAVFTEESLAELEEALAEQIREECESAFYKTVRDYQSDVFLLGDLLWQKQADYWSLMREVWPQGAEEISIECEVSAEIDRTGLQIVKE